MCSSKNTLYTFNQICKRYGRLRRPRDPRGGLYREARNILFADVNQGTRSMLASALGQHQMNNEQNPWANLGATVRTPEAAAGGEAVARGAGVRSTPQWNGRNNAWAEWSARDNSWSGWSSWRWRPQ